MDEAQHEDESVDAYAPRELQYQHLKLDTVEGIARITLNRPPANVLSIEMMQELNAALESLEYQREIKLLVIAGSGKYFSAGFELSDHLAERAYLMLEQFRRIFENLAKLDKPTLAIVAGPALGAGSMLAAACDITLAAVSAKFGHPEIKAGVFNTVAVSLLPRLVGRKKAAEIILGGQSLSAADAERVGLISRAVPDDRLEAETGALIQRFSDSSAPVLQATRRAMWLAFDLPMSEAFRQAEDVYLNQLMASEDAEEGLRAVMAKRKPVWKDR